MPGEERERMYEIPESRLRELSQAEERLADTERERDEAVAKLGGPLDRDFVPREQLVAAQGQSERNRESRQAAEDRAEKAEAEAVESEGALRLCAIDLLEGEGKVGVNPSSCMEDYRNRAAALSNPPTGEGTD